jgi:hypothetical protein
MFDFLAISGPPPSLPAFRVNPSLHLAEQHAILISDAGWMKQNKEGI